MCYNDNFHELQIKCDIEFFRDLINFYHDYCVSLDVHDGSMSFNEFLKNALFDGASGLASKV